MSLIERFERARPPGQPPEFAQLRRVPIQPSGLPLGQLYLGVELGFASFSGPAPQPGDLVLVLGDPANRVALPQQRPPQRNPIFSPVSCRCRCPADEGLALYASSVARNTVIHAVDAMTATILQSFGLADVWYGRGLAVDEAAPHDCFVLDDRRILLTILTQANPTFQRNYFAVTKFAISGGQYTFASRISLTDPLPPPGTAAASDFPNIDTETADQDPPNFTTNGLSVVAGQAHLTFFKPPARYLRLEGGVLVSHTLTLSGANYNKGLRGNVVGTPPDKPAPRDRRYAIARDATTGSYELVEFDASDAITQIFTIDASPPPKQLATVCNRLLVLCSSQAYLFPFSENLP